MTEYDVIADYYDLLFGDRTVDIPFWVKLAKDTGSPVLELACGTGRIALPIARAGPAITGIDIAAQMLDIARAKLEREPPNVRARVTLIGADANAFHLPGRRFKAIFSPWGFPPVTEAEQASCLASVRECLLPGGYFAVDVYNAKEPTEDWQYYDVEPAKAFPDQGFTLVRRAHTTGSARTKTQHIVFFLDKIEEDGTTERLITERDQRVYTRGDLEALLAGHGFRIEQVYGDYDFSPHTSDSARVIVVARIK
ncbi:MAG: methyltransferase domain-containing protein [Anaerolineae bacterium]|nr:methyltransferase domain-containing protein [Anaerolineae bacterium]